MLETSKQDQTEEDIKVRDAELEQRVAERTRELTNLTEILKSEIAELRQVEEAVRRSEDRTRIKWYGMAIDIEDRSKHKLCFMPKSKSFAPSSKTLPIKLSDTIDSFIAPT